jgi:hypothetical protein
MMRPEATQFLTQTTYNSMTDAIKQQAMIEALEFYINNLKEINANQAAIDLFTEVLADVEEEVW